MVAPAPVDVAARCRRTGAAARDARDTEGGTGCDWGHCGSVRRPAHPADAWQPRGKRDQVRGAGGGRAGNCHWRRPGDIIAVRNCGPAISPSFLCRVFEPLERGPGAETRPGSEDSLGLGLYIAREIAHARGGEIAARSDESETDFTVRLPRVAPDICKDPPHQR
ncbi:sensor histidine kinase [Paraburkholderia sp. BL18I3N2]|uniref:sensor histidine kinase n=1 Tax=Paraburkholderia sp. BL18I3N2 TaxID=1938799 RepID=UPI0035BE175F